MSNEQILALVVIISIASAFAYFFGKKSVNKKTIVAIDVGAKTFKEEDLINSLEQDPSSGTKTPKEKISENLGKDISDLDILDSRNDKK
jgi:hypothetical protein